MGAIKDWVKNHKKLTLAIMGTVAAPFIAFGVRDTIGTAATALWKGVYGIVREQPMATLEYPLSNGGTYRVRFPENSESALRNYLDARGISDDTALELIAADANDGAVDGIADQEGIQKLANGYFAVQAKAYGGNLGIQEVIQNASPKFDAKPVPGQPRIKSGE